MYSLYSICYTQLFLFQLFDDNIYFFSWQDLKDFMRKAGEVTYGAAHDGEVGKNRGIVCFERKKDAERAVDDLDGRELNGRTVSIHSTISTLGAVNRFWGEVPH